LQRNIIPGYDIIIAVQIEEIDKKTMIPEIIIRKGVLNMIQKMMVFSPEATQEDNTAVWSALRNQWNQIGDAFKNLQEVTSQPLSREEQAGLDFLRNSTPEQQEDMFKALQNMFNSMLQTEQEDYLAKAEAGDPQAQYQAGNCYMDGT